MKIRGKKKQKTAEKFFQWEIDPTPNRVPVGGPSEAPPETRDSLRDMPALNFPLRAAGQNGGAPFLRSGQNFDFFVVNLTHFYITKTFVNSTRKIIHFIEFFKFCFHFNF